VSEERGSRVGKRQFRSVELKRQIVEETFDGETSVAVVARRYGVNANQVFSWRRQCHRGELVVSPSAVLEPTLQAVQVHQPTMPARSERACAVEGAVRVKVVAGAPGDQRRVGGASPPQ
jgi:transposase